MNSLSPIAALLATLAVLAFLMTAAGFLTLTWKAGWAMGKFVNTVESAAGTAKELLAMFRNFVEVQAKRNDDFELALQVQAERLNTLVEREAISNQRSALSQQQALRADG